MSVTSEDQEAQDVVHFPDSRDDDNHISPTNRVSSSSSSPHTDSHSHCSHSEDDSNEDDYSSDYSSSEDDDGNHHHPQQPPFSQHTFAPPFYGRPPTPLPPSPSLTSLLRPSRPTTPDASDDEGNSTTGGNGPTHNSRGLAQGSDPVPRASPKVPTYEYYGFVLYLFSTLSFLIYLLWSYLPSPFLHAIGVYYYPNRWWSVAIPSFLVMALVYIYVALALYNTEYLTLSLGSVETVVDEAANVAVVDSKGRLRKGGDGPVKWTGNGSGKVHGHGHGHGKEKGKKVKGKAHGGGGVNAGREKRRTAVERERERERRKDVLFPDGTLNWREVWNEGTDAVMDVPLGGVCEVLYGELRDGGDLEEDEYEVDESEIITRL
ncbi:PIG-P-domain-containing protein [Rhypophila decipiens]|uniref:PIG-P-domain-containing protein n=1 Tax=Rhypophila decipiens TaxID=261697 RepID=A0AAN6YIS7_9PEZI|nr:PIG-P-domain-containing protein [Rhypophila decipiens]